MTSTVETLKVSTEVTDADVILSAGFTPKDQNQSVAKWRVREAWPCKYEGPDLKARDNGVAMESLEICHEGLERLA